MALSSLQAIREKVRRITRCPSEAQLTTAQLDQYINTYVLYDFPETLRLFNLRTTFSFYTLPFVDTYSTMTNENSNLYNFTNKYITTDAPVYIGGRQVLYSESREQFFNIYPLINSIASIGESGDATTQMFTGVITSAQANTQFITGQQSVFLQNNVLFSSIDANNNGLAMQDSPIIDATTKNPTNYGLLYNALNTNAQSTTPSPYAIPVLELTAPYTSDVNFPTFNYINYVTGEFVVTFDTAPGAGVAINSQTVQVQPTIPQALLFYDGAFTVRPVPDQSYKVNMEVFIQPTELLTENQTPELSEWWQLIAWNAAKKILEDKLDYDTLNLIMPSLKEQEILVNRRTIVQQTSQRSATIYSNQTGMGSSFGPGSNFGSW